MVLRTLAGIGLIAALAGCGSSPTAGERPAVVPEAITEGAQALRTLPDGWRWESYRDVVVAVPSEWIHYTSSSQQITQWCVARGNQLRAPSVGRPGPSTAAGCTGDKVDGVSPGSLLKNGGAFVAFAAGAGQTLRTEGDRTVVVVGDVAVVIQAEEALREQIAATVQQRDRADHNGCSLTHPISADPGWRPDPFDPAVFTDVTSMTACRYDFLTHGNTPTPVGSTALVSSVRVTGERASRTAVAIAESPLGGGPDNASQCAVSAHYGDEAIVVRLERAVGGPVYLVVRFSGCNYNGIDDGTAVHRLTWESAGAFFEGPNSISAFSGNAEKAKVLHPESAAGAHAKEKSLKGR